MLLDVRISQWIVLRFPDFVPISEKYGGEKRVKCPFFSFKQLQNDFNLLHGCFSSFSLYHEDMILFFDLIDFQIQKISIRDLFYKSLCEQKRTTFNLECCTSGKRRRIKGDFSTGEKGWIWAFWGLKDFGRLSGLNWRNLIWKGLGRKERLRKVSRLEFSRKRRIHGKSLKTCICNLER